MKRVFYIFFFFILLSSCLSESYLKTEPVNPEVKPLQISEEKDPYFVDMRDVDKYVDFKVLEARGKGKSLTLKDVEPIYSATGEIFMYVVQYNDGWDVISADKRTPLLMATSESGEFKSSENETQQFYFDMVADDVRMYALHEDKNLIQTKSISTEADENAEFWDAITVSDEYITEYLLENGFPRDSLPLLQEGHWELLDVESEREAYETVDHLIPFQWGQNLPYNTYSPNRKVVSNGEYKAPAGCVAVAGAQTLAYLQDLYDLEIPIPSIIYVTGDTDSHTSIPDAFTTSLWPSIDIPLDASLLIAYIGILVDTDYGESVSLASTSKLEEIFAEEFGINCSYETYDSDAVKSNLLNAIPTIVAAKSVNNSSAVGHSFIIDGYRSYRNKYTYTYEWVYDGPSSEPIEMKPNKIEISYSSPIVENIKINWGSTNPTGEPEDGWYTPTGDWPVNLGYGSENYKYYREMLYGFSIIE